MGAIRRFRALLDIATRVAGMPALGAGEKPKALPAARADGSVFSTSIRTAEGVAPRYVRIAKGISGHGLARFSSGLFRGEHGWPDLMGLALRFGTDPDGPEPFEGEQDLFLVTTSRLRSLPLDAVRTDRSDYLKNTYHGMTPFKIDETARVSVRLVPLHANGVGLDREDRLRNAVASGLARFRLEAAPVDDPVSIEPIVEIELREELAIDEGALSFSPFRTGLGLRPQGFVYFLRPATYGLRRLARREAHG